MEEAAGAESKLCSDRARVARSLRGCFRLMRRARAHGLGLSPRFLAETQAWFLLFWGLAEVAANW
ncbi:hypothetical protein FG93_04669 [Bosea sp. LC85]|nr:hypothetical protein FG93_04669 [Bosea sp. LC85]